MNTNLLAALALVALPASALAGDKFEFRAEAGARVLKTATVVHELRIDDMGQSTGDLPFVSDGRGGWLSVTQRTEFLDEYTEASTGLPRAFKRAVREANLTGKSSLTVAAGEMRPEGSRMSSALQRQILEFRWVDDEKDWSRCFEKVDAEESLLRELRGEFELLALLPPGEVEPGATWTVDLARFRDVLCPGGNLQLIPEGGSLFGRTLKIGVGGNYADYYEPVGGEIKATYKGRRAVQTGEGEPAPQVQAGVIALELHIVSLTDRKQLYRMAMPPAERRENAKVETVPLEYTLAGTAELLWDLDHGRALSFRLEGQEGYVSTVNKTRYNTAKPEPYAQRTMLSGPVKYGIDFTDGTNVELLPEKVNPRADSQRRKK